MKRKHLIVLVSISILLLVLATLTYFIRSRSIERAQNEAAKTIFSEQPEAVFLDAQSNPISMATYEGKILVVNVWASWSPYTTIEFPILNEVAAGYKDKGVVFLGINRKETQPQIERYLAENPRFDNLTLITDVNDFFYAGVDGYAMPETIIYDSKGKIVQHIRGVLVKQDLENILNTLIN